MYIYIHIYINVTIIRCLVYIIIMKRKKFHCMNCNAELEIYKKGKGHRLLVCPNCGIVANNPGLLKKVARGFAKSVPVLGTAINVIDELKTDKAEKKDGKEILIKSPTNFKNTKSYYVINEALYGGRR